MKLKIITKDKEFLRKQCAKIEKIDDSIKKLAHEMLDFMYATNGVGLAAIQIGELIRLVVIDVQVNKKKNPIYLINPEIIWKSDEMITSEGEGCLSIPGVRATVERHKQVKVKYLDLNGEENIIEADAENEQQGLLCICLQHEIEHLDGIVFINHLSKQKQRLLEDKSRKFLKEEARKAKEAEQATLNDINTSLYDTHNKTVSINSNE